MSQSTVQERIRANPKFQSLVAQRTRLAVGLSLIVLVPFYTFMFLVSMQPQIFGAKISEGSVITIGWPLAAVLIIGGWLMTGIYVNRANGEFDEITKEILKEASK